MKEKIIRNGINVLKIILFMCLIGVVFYGINFVLRLKTIDGCYVAQMFEKQKEDTVDVVFIGSSHIYTNVNPAILWSEYGMATYDLAGSDQPLWNSYYYMKEAIEKQSPKLIVVDLYRVLEKRDVIDDARIAMNTLGLTYSDNKLESIRASIPDDYNENDYIFGFPVYHNRYQTVEKEDFMPYGGDVNKENYKGFNYNCVSIQSFDYFNDVTWVEDECAVTEKNEKYLKLMMELAKETDTELLFIVAPYWEISTNDKTMFNYVEKLADEEKIPFIDFNECYDAIGLDSHTDCAESSHLNYYGSEKFTRYLGDIIHTQYKIPDHRGDVKYESWENNAKYYEKIAVNFRLRNARDLKEYFGQLFSNQNYTFCIWLKGNYDGENSEIVNMLDKYGLNLCGDAVVMYDKGERIFCADESKTEDYIFYKDLGTQTLVIEGGTVEADISVDKKKIAVIPKVTLNRYGCDKVNNGINILLYDNYTNKVIENVGFDACQEYRKIR